MHAVRVMLRDGRARSVTEAAMHHGFWELSRFAVEYRATFGEPPSATLQHTAPSRSTILV
jgi:AraC family ethanolamine operon transcriptional activator